MYYYLLWGKLWKNEKPGGKKFLSRESKIRKFERANHEIFLRSYIISKKIVTKIET
jgi:hypothetical protein